MPENYGVVKLRMKRLGRRNRAYYRLCAMDARTRRDGRAIEELGFYDPVVRDTAKQASIKAERVKYWLSVGAQPSDTVRRMCEKLGIEMPEHVKRRQAVVQKQRTRQQKKNADKAAKKAATQAALEAAKAAKEAKPAEAKAEEKKD